MARIIVNEGSGPRVVELQGLVTVGSNPSCDVVLAHESALGVRIELKPLRFGYRAKLIKGEARLNESSFEMADLDHNDTLHVGEVMLLYKQPEGAEFAPPAAAPVTPEGLELLDDLDELPELELEALEEVDDLEELPELDVLEELPAEPAARRRGAVEEIDLVPERPAEPAQPDPGLEEALLRARWKRLEMLRRLQRVQAGELESYPDLRDPGALDIAQQLDLEGRAAPLEQLEADEQLTEASLPELAERVEQARAAAKQAADAHAAESAAVAAAAAAAAVGDQADEALEELEELPLDELDELEPLEELEALPELELEPVDEPAAVSVAAAATARDDAPRAPEREPASAAPSGASGGVRPLPPEGIRWRRPLPPGRRGPTYLPPVHPGARAR